MLKNTILLTQNVGDYQIDNLVLLVLGRAPMLKNIILLTQNVGDYQIDNLVL